MPTTKQIRQSMNQESLAKLETDAGNLSSALEEATQAALYINTSKSDFLAALKDYRRAPQIGPRRSYQDKKKDGAELPDLELNEFSHRETRQRADLSQKAYEAMIAATYDLTAPLYLTEQKGINDFTIQGSDWIEVQEHHDILPFFLNSGTDEAAIEENTRLLQEVVGHNIDRTNIDELEQHKQEIFAAHLNRMMADILADDYTSYTGMDKEKLVEHWEEYFVKMEKLVALKAELEKEPVNPFISQSMAKQCMDLNGKYVPEYQQNKNRMEIMANPYYSIMDETQIYELNAADGNAVLSDAFDQDDNNLTRYLDNIKSLRELDDLRFQTEITTYLKENKNPDLSGNFVCAKEDGTPITNAEFRDYLRSGKTFFVVPEEDTRSVYAFSLDQNSGTFAEKSIEPYADIAEGLTFRLTPENELTGAERARKVLNAKHEIQDKGSRTLDALLNVEVHAAEQNISKEDFLNALKGTVGNPKLSFHEEFRKNKTAKNLPDVDLREFSLEEQKSRKELSEKAILAAGGSIYDIEYAANEVHREGIRQGWFTEEQYKKAYKRDIFRLVLDPEQTPEMNKEIICILAGMKVDPNSKTPELDQQMLVAGVVNSALRRMDEEEEELPDPDHMTDEELVNAWGSYYAKAYKLSTMDKALEGLIEENNYIDRDLLKKLQEKQSIMESYNRSIQRMEMIANPYYATVDYQQITELPTSEISWMNSPMDFTDHPTAQNDRDLQHFLMGMAVAIEVDSTQKKQEVADYLRTQKQIRIPKESNPNISCHTENGAKMSDLEMREKIMTHEVFLVVSASDPEKIAAMQMDEEGHLVEVPLDPYREQAEAIKGSARAKKAEQDKEKAVEESKERHEARTAGEEPLMREELRDRLIDSRLDAVAKSKEPKELKAVEEEILTDLYRLSAIAMNKNLKDRDLEMKETFNNLLAHEAVYHVASSKNLPEDALKQLTGKETFEQFKKSMSDPHFLEAAMKNLPTEPDQIAGMTYEKIHMRAVLAAKQMKEEADQIKAEEEQNRQEMLKDREEDYKEISESFENTENQMEQMKEKKLFGTSLEEIAAANTGADNRPIISGISQTRASIQSMAVAKLLTEGKYKLQEIFDPGPDGTKIRTEAKEDILKKIRNKDARSIAKYLGNALVKTGDLVENMLSGMTEFSPKEFFEKKNLDVTTLVYWVKDFSQEFDHVTKNLPQDEQKEVKAVYKPFQDRQEALSLFSGSVLMNFVDCNKEKGPLFSTRAVTYAASLASFAYLKAKMNLPENRDKRISEVINVEDGTVAFAETMGKLIPDTNKFKIFDKDMQKREGIMRAFADGTFYEDLKMKVDLNPDGSFKDITYDLDTAIKNAADRAPIKAEMDQKELNKQKMKEEMNKELPEDQKIMLQGI